MPKKQNTKNNQPSPRALAATIVHAVCEHQQQLNDSLREVFANNVIENYGPVIHELAYGTLRWLIQLQWITTQLLDKPIRKKDRDIQTLILVGLYELRYMHTATHACVNETVSATLALDKPWAKNLVNACLRKYLRKEKEINAHIDEETALQTSHPQWLIDSLKEAWPEHWQNILQANNTRPPMGLRINQKQTSRDQYINLLNEAAIENHAMEISTTGIMLKKPVPVTKLPGFAEGWVTVQDGAAQLAGQLLGLQENQSVLDACCAPGGKLAHILELIPESTKVTGLDISKNRLALVKENLQRLHLSCPLSQADVSHIDAGDFNEWWHGDCFDRILVDAPCSATGVIRRHPDIKHHRQPEDINNIVQLQQQILNSLWPLLASGGKLVYATCSILPVENDLQIAAFLQAHTDASALPLDTALANTEASFLKEHVMAMNHGFQILPGFMELDGFYYACLQKNND